MTRAVLWKENQGIVLNKLANTYKEDILGLIPQQKILEALHSTNFSKSVEYF